MKKIIGLLLMILLPIGHAANLTGENGVEILAIDGKKVTSAFLASSEIAINDGNHQVVVKYSQHFKKGTTVSSKPHILDLTINGDTKISIAKIRSQEQAKRIISSGLIWQVSNKQGTQEFANSDTLSGKGLFPYRDIEKLIADYNFAHGVTPATTIATKSNLESQSAMTNSAVSEAKLQQLMQLYMDASVAERNAFRLWIVEQGIK